MILNIPDPLAFFTELSEVSVILNGKVTPEALYALRKYEQQEDQPNMLRLSPRCGVCGNPLHQHGAKDDPCPVDRFAWYRRVGDEYVPMAVPCEGDNPDGVD